MAWFGQHWINDVIACVIRDEARRIGCPEFIALGIAGGESNWDPMAVGDAGCSWGLFQLYICNGQGQEYRLFPERLLNPRLNSRVAMPPIEAAYRYCGGLGVRGADQIACTAIGSGHPGRVPVSDPRVQRIVRITLELIFNRDGSWAVWPTFRPSVCDQVVIPPEPPPPPPPEPLPAFGDLEPVEPPTEEAPDVAALAPVEPPPEPVA